jgi:hypothetical protein
VAKREISVSDNLVFRDLALGVPSPIRYSLTALLLRRQYSLRLIFGDSEHARLASKAIRSLRWYRNQFSIACERESITVKTKRTAARLAVGAWLLYLSVLAPSLATWDGGGMLNVAVSVLQKHDLTVEPVFGTPGRGGKLYDGHYPLLSFVVIPFAALGLFAAGYSHLPAIYVVAVFAILLSTIIAALNVGATYNLARICLGATERRAVAAALAFGFGTLALRYSRSFYADPLLTLVTTAALIALFAENPRALLLAPLCGLAILAKPVGFLLAAGVFVYLVFQRNYLPAFISAFGSGIGAGLYAAYDWARFGNIFTSGQPNIWSLRIMPIGFAGLLISPGVGLLVCCPMLILAFRKHIDRKAYLILSLTAGYLLFYSCWRTWFASDWGPRFLMPVIPALLALSVLTRYRRLWLTLALLGAIMQVPTVFGSPERYEAVVSQHGINERNAVWHISLSSTVGMWRSAFEQIQDARQHPDTREFAAYRPTATTFVDSRNYRIVPLWWWMLPLIHVPRVFGMMIALGEILAGLWIISKRDVSEIAPSSSCS